MNNIDFHSSIYSEPNSITGGISADGAGNLMGATSLSPIEIVLRETLQNSWDASLGQSTQPVFNINVRSLSESEKNCINNFLSERPPLGTFDRERLDKFLVKENKVVLEISDFGTKGLGGPLSASESHEDDKDYDFVNFVKNFGSHKHKENQGGEYGYGKSSFFNISSCRTIIINSLTSYEGKLENRLIGYSLGSAFNFEKQRYTGRHWWGSMKHSENFNYVDPFLDEYAVKLAEDMGMPKRNNDLTKGTTLMILDPDLSELFDGIEFQSQEDKSNYLSTRIQDLILWHAWPKFTPNNNGETPMKCNVSVFEKVDSIPDPHNIYPYSLLAEALKEARDKKNNIYSKKHKIILGYSGSQQSGLLGRESKYKNLLGENSKIPDKLSHFALLRPAELVVKYLKPFKELDDRQPQWGAVFISSEKKLVEEAFRKSEPPAHDDWKPEGSPFISADQKTFVKTALREIKSEMRKLSGDTSELIFDTKNNDQSSLAWFAGELGQSMIGKGFGGSDGSRDSTNKNTGTKKRNKTILSRPNYCGTKFIDGKVVADFSMEISSSKGKNIELEFCPLVISDGKEKSSKAPNGKELKIVKFEAEKHFVLDQLNSENENLTSKLMKKYDKNDLYNEELIKPQLKLNSDSVKIFVSVEVPDNVAVSLSAEIKDKGF